MNPLPGSPQRAGHAWFWPLVLVTALHLLSTAGRWWITDHGEILAVADHFLSSGRLDLKDLGPGWEDWTRIALARGSFATRFQPLSILLLVPLLALDHLFGWREPSTFRFVHLEGHLFVTLGLGLVGRWISRQGVPASVTALSLLLLGLNWPVWMIARRIGPEPVLFALLALFATSGPRVRFVAQVLLPWVHASGPLLGLGAWLWLARSRGSFKDASVRLSALGLILGVLSLGFFWNLPVHGHVLVGGYDRYSNDAFFTIRNPLAGALSLIPAMILPILPYGYLVARGGRKALFDVLSLGFPLIALLSLFSNPEPQRRLAPLFAILAIIVIPALSSVPRRGRIGLASLALASGVFGLSGDFVDTVRTPLGVFSGPALLFLRLAFEEGRPQLAGVLAGILLILVLVAGSRTLDLILNAPRGATNRGFGRTATMSENVVP